VRETVVSCIVPVIALQAIVCIVICYCNYTAVLSLYLLLRLCADERDEVGWA
jgi:hypothetical protein